MTTNNNISFVAGVAIAFSSIIGAGVLFLPAQVQSTAMGWSFVIFLWGFGFAVATSFIITNLAFTKGHEGRNLQNIISTNFPALPRTLAPLLLNLALLFGLPVAAIYAARVVVLLIPNGGIEYQWYALFIIVLAMSVNLFNLRFSLIIQTCVVGAICVAVAMLLPEVTFPYDIIKDREPITLASIGSALLMVILGFAGLENMPALAKRFRGGSSSFLTSMICGAFLALVVYLIVLMMINSHNATSINGGMSWLSSPKANGNSSLIRMASILMVFAVIGNVITWNIGMTETWIGIIAHPNSKTKFRVQITMCLGYLSVIFLIYMKIIDEQYAVAQAGAIFSVIYLFLAVACAKSRSHWVIRMTALILVVLMLLILGLNSQFLILPIILLSTAILRPQLWIRKRSSK